MRHFGARRNDTHLDPNRLNFACSCMLMDVTLIEKLLQQSIGLKFGLGSLNEVMLISHYNPYGNSGCIQTSLFFCSTVVAFFCSSYFIFDMYLCNCITLNS